MHCKNVKMKKKTRITSTLLALILGNFGSHKLFHKQYLEMLLYIISNGFHYIGVFVDTFVYIFDPDFTTYQAESGPIKKFRTYEFIIKIIASVLCLGYSSIGIVRNFYLYRDASLESIYVLALVIIIAIVNGIVYCCTKKYCSDVDESPLKEEEEGINETFEGIVDQSELVTPKRIREHLIWYIVGIIIWAGTYVPFRVLSNRYVDLVDDKKYYESQVKSMGDNDTIEKFFMGLEGSLDVASEERWVLVDNKNHTYRINYPKGSTLNSNNIVVFYSNPEKSREKEYRPVMERLTSWGYVVVGNDDSKTSFSGKVLAQVIQDFKKNIGYSKSIIVGIKLGASGAMKAVIEHLPENIQIDGLYLNELYSSTVLTRYGKDYTYDTSLLKKKIPNIAVVEAGFIMSSRYMNSDDWIKDIHENITNICNEVIALRMKTVFPDKVMPADDGFLTAWLEGHFDDNKKGNWKSYKENILRDTTRWENPEKPNTEK